MPTDRFIHPKLGHSEKVNGLTDLEFRVWIQYLLSADDFGVMRMSAVTVQAGSDVLARRPRRLMERCLQELLECGLLMDFQHQGRRYLCQRDWQDYQKIRYPRETSNPLPPTEMLSRFSGATTKLFLLHSRNTSETNQNDSGNVPETFQRPARAGGREEATANGNGLEQRFSEFWKHYPRKVGKTLAWRAWQKLRPSAGLLATMLAVLAWQRKSPDWSKERGRYVPYPATWLNRGQWEDEPPTVGTSPATEARDCPHTPSCENPGNWRCLQRTQLEALKP